ncbi:MAG TPA: Rrf2 family transcriptional regulator [Dehalococcoidales bacterium]|nr:Rrf2 family transcriptional regulator [Dehalococcoidales bacterium]
MKLSTKGRYAMRAMLDLAQHYGEGLILLKDVARRQDISERYLEHLFLTLKAAGLVTSARGARGGFVLSHAPSEIKLLNIIRACEGDLAPVECVRDPSTCNRASRCSARDVWCDLKEALESVLEKKSLQDMVEEQAKKESTANHMYVI